jgi:DNA polymerase III subunit epsilon
MTFILLFVFSSAIVWYWLKARTVDSSAYTPQKALQLKRSLPQNFVVFDLETTGLDPNKTSIIEIGAVLVNRDSADHTTFNCLVKPTNKLRPKTISLTGITQSMIDEDGLELKDAWAQFADFVGSYRLVAFNAQFDLGFLRVACNRSGMLNFSNPVDCALQRAREAWPHLPSYKLSSLAERGGMSLEHSHRALPDCERTMQIYATAMIALKG